MRHCVEQTARLPCEAYVGPGVQHGTKAEDQNDDFLLPRWPIERVIGILAGLGRQHDVGIPPRAMFECLRDLFGMSCLVVEEHGPRNVRELSICRAVSCLTYSVCQLEQKIASWEGGVVYIPSNTPRPILLELFPDIPRYFYRSSSWEDEKVAWWSEDDVWRCLQGGM